MNIIFFGSTHDSVTVLETLHAKYPVIAVVTQPAKPVGRDQTLTPTPVEIWAKKQKITVLTFPQNTEKPWLFADETEVTNAVSSLKPDLIVTASFGERIPKETLALARHGGVNVHPSLLPRWRGAYPVPWTILAGDAQTGVSISTVTERFDDGKILSQKKIPVTEKDTADELRVRLFTMGAALLVETLPEYLNGKNPGTAQKKEDMTTARKLTREDGFIPWELLQSGILGIEISREQRSGLLTTMDSGLSTGIDRMYRALTPWPGIWTTVNPEQGKTKTIIGKRLKLIQLSVGNGQLLPKVVQLEGKNPVDWETFVQAYLQT